MLFFPCYVLHAWCSGSVKVDFLFVHETHLSVVFEARHPSLLSGSFLVEPDVSPHLNPYRTDCVRVQRSVISIVNCLVRDSSSFVTSPRVIVNHAHTINSKW